MNKAYIRYSQLKREVEKGKRQIVKGDFISSLSYLFKKPKLPRFIKNLNKQSKMKKTIQLFTLLLIISSCSTTNKIPVLYNKYGGVHWEKYEERNGKIFVKGREVKLLKEKVFTLK